ncbi:MAG: carbonate dehydratase [Bacteroidia bacterium]
MADHQIEATYQQLLKGNEDWVERTNAEDPGFFERLASGQSPKFLWIGCADSRVPTSQITDTLPGEIFVHRNIANMVVHTDINMLSVLQYAVDVLEVEHVIVCGHYGCGGVDAALGNRSYGLIDNWLRNIKDVYRLHMKELEQLKGRPLSDRMVELNVIEQVYNLCKTNIIQEAWSRGHHPHVHGWVYSLKDGRIKDLGVTVRDNDDMHSIYQYEEFGID